ncbi:MAG TPA: amidohydrolase family protein [Pyrinomonadaceae bacterium]|jgi:5-methylthioadenosine/S-adenosylhomocysteine deaminase
MTTIYCARWVLPVSSGMIERGAVAVEGERIVGVGERDSLAAKFPEALAQDFGEAAILPGFVNAHSHLELTAMRGYLEDKEDDFFGWLRKITVARLERMTPDDLYVCAAWGAVEAARAGVTCLGDSSDAASASLRALRHVGLRGVVYQEAFGPDPRLAREHFEKLREKVYGLREYESAHTRTGVSPHSPYTVSAPQLELITDFAISEKLPVMIHAAESLAEEQLLREGVGPFAEGLARRGIEWRAPGVSPIEYLRQVGSLRARPLLAHCIRVNESDIETIRGADASIAHCPKSNAKLGHGHAPFAAFIREGVRVGLGSDSVASNNNCDMLEEARFAALMSRATRDQSDASPMTGSQDVLFAATLGGARALGLDNQTGALEEGLQADLTIIGLDGPHQLPVHDPSHALVFASSGHDVLLTIVAGREVFRDDHVNTIDEERLRARMREIRHALASDE